MAEVNRIEDFKPRLRGEAPRFQKWISITCADDISSLREAGYRCALVHH